MIIAMAGLPGAGKTTLANALRAYWAPRRAVVLSKDRIRAELFSSEDIEYSIDQDDLCMDVVFRVAEFLIRRNPDRPVILDGRTFSKASQRVPVVALSERTGVPLFWVSCVCADSAALARIVQDAASGSHLAANRTPELYWKLKEAVEPITQQHLIIETDQNSVQACLNKVAGWIDSLDSQLA